LVFGTFGYLQRNGIQRSVFYSGDRSSSLRAHSDIQTIARRIPVRQLLTETDNPGGPKGLIGGSGMPLLLKDVVQGVAEARKSPAKAIIQTVQDNMMELMQEDPWLADTYAKMSNEWQTKANKSLESDA
jgi:Tat protein secretion system quality control protein TatD with DNase activity